MRMFGLAVALTVAVVAAPAKAEANGTQVCFAVNGGAEYSGIPGTGGFIVVEITGAGSFAWLTGHWLTRGSSAPVMGTVYLRTDGTAIVGFEVITNIEATGVLAALHPPDYTTGGIVFTPRGGTVKRSAFGVVPCFAWLVDANIGLVP